MLGRSQIFVSLCVLMILASFIVATWWASRYVTTKEYQAKHVALIASQTTELESCNSKLIDWCDGRRMRIAKCNNTTYVCFCASDRDFDDGSHIGVP